MPRIKTVSREDVLRLAAELAQEYGESLTLTAFRRETGLSQWAIFDLFGNWKNLRMQVGLTPEAPRARCKVSQGHILKLMREQVRAQGRDLTERDFLQATGLSGRLVVDRFGSWGALRQQVGLEPRARMKPRYSYEDLMEDMYRVYRRYRCKPVYAKHRFRGGVINPATMQHRFGSWNEACRAFQAWLIDRKGVDSDWEPLPEDPENGWQVELKRREQEKARRPWW